ncbi:hypothetical protein C8R44DRAFT_752820 [Mycena epipterygia]|nr:hypothetical protein C8R44DRAFT_752820 [Mycena epipterygia]
MQYTKGCNWMGQRRGVWRMAREGCESEIQGLGCTRRSGAGSKRIVARKRKKVIKEQTGCADCTSTGGMRRGVEFRIATDAWRDAGGERGPGVGIPSPSLAISNAVNWRIKATTSNEFPARLQRDVSTSSHGNAENRGFGAISLARSFTSLFPRLGAHGLLVVTDIRGEIFECETVSGSGKNAAAGAALTRIDAAVTRSDAA